MGKAGRQFKVGVGRQLTTLRHLTRDLCAQVGGKGCTVDVVAVVAVGLSGCAVIDDFDIGGAGEKGSKIGLGHDRIGKVVNFLPVAPPFARQQTPLRRFQFETARPVQHIATLRPERHHHFLGAQVGAALDVEILPLAAAANVGDAGNRDDFLCNVGGKFIGADFAYPLPDLIDGSLGRARLRRPGGDAIGQE